MSRHVLKVAGLVALAILGTIYLMRPGFAADKGGPPVKVDAQGVEKPLFTGCYGQLGGGGIFASGNDTIKGFAIGAGCDWQVGTLVIGANGKYGLYQDDTRALSIGGRLGYAINPHTLAYAHVSLLMDGRNPSFDDSVIMGGIGGETYLTKSMTLFIELATDLQKLGDFKTMPEVYEIHGGIRIRF